MDYLKSKHFNKVFAKKDSYPDRENNKLIDVLKNYKFNSLLEIGCGNGRNLDLIRKKTDIKDLKGIDISDVGVKYARERGLDVVVGSANNLPYSDKSFDIVLTYHSLEQMKYIIDDVVKEINRVSKKYVISFEPCFELQNIFGKFHNFMQDYVKGLPYIFEKYGFKVECFKRLNGGKWKNRTCLLICKL